jgi:signal peptidase II
MSKEKCFLSNILNCKKSPITGNSSCCKKTWIVWSALGAVAIVDRFSKLLATHSCQESFSLTSWLQCDLVINRGVSFGLFHADSFWIFGAVTVFVMALTSVVAFHAIAQARKGHSYVGELCIIVGSLSNLLDRFIYDGVIDFIIVKTPWGFWPAYNIADALIVLGVVLLIIINYRES